MQNRPDLLATSAEDTALVMSDSELFWQEHWQKFVWGLAAIVVLILATGAWMLYASHVRSSAEALYSTANSPESWREVMRQYPGSEPAGNAQIRLAASLRESGDLDGAAVELESFTEKYPEHPLAGAAWLTLGEIRQTQDRAESALQAYRMSSSKYQDAYTAPIAMIAEAKLLADQDRTGEARAVLESINSLYPQTPAAMVADGELSRLPSQPPQP
jgi:TolA-binding protein